MLNFSYRRRFINKFSLFSFAESDAMSARWLSCVDVRSEQSHEIHILKSRHIRSPYSEMCVFAMYILRCDVRARNITHVTRSHEISTTVLLHLLATAVKDLPAAKDESRKFISRNRRDFTLELTTYTSLSCTLLHISRETFRLKMTWNFQNISCVSLWYSQIVRHGLESSYAMNIWMWWKLNTQQMAPHCFSILHVGPSAARHIDDMRLQRYNKLSRALWGGANYC